MAFKRIDLLFGKKPIATSNLTEPDSLKPSVKFDETCIFGTKSNNPNFIGDTFSFQAPSVKEQNIDYTKGIDDSVNPFSDETKNKLEDVKKILDDVFSDEECDEDKNGLLDALNKNNVDIVKAVLSKETNNEVSTYSKYDFEDLYSLAFNITPENKNLILKLAQTKNPNGRFNILNFSLANKMSYLNEFIERINVTPEKEAVINNLIEKRSDDKNLFEDIFNLVDTENILPEYQEQISKMIAIKNSNDGSYLFRGNLIKSIIENIPSEKVSKLISSDEVLALISEMKNTTEDRSWFNNDYEILQILDIHLPQNTDLIKKIIRTKNPDGSFVYDERVLDYMPGELTESNKMFVMKLVEEKFPANKFPDILKINGVNTPFKADSCILLANIITDENKNKYTYFEINEIIKNINNENDFKRLTELVKNKDLNANPFEIIKCLKEGKDSLQSESANTLPQSTYEDETIINLINKSQKIYEEEKDRVKNSGESDTLFFDRFREGSGSSVTLEEFEAAMKRHPEQAINIKEIINSDKISEKEKIELLNTYSDCSYASESYFNDLVKVAKGESIVKDYSKNTPDLEVLKDTPVGEAAQIGNKLFINDDGKLVELGVTKETYLKLFPPVERFDFEQGSNTCWLVSSIDGAMSRPSARAKLLQLFREEKGNIFVKLPKGLEVKFPNGEVAPTKHNLKTGPKGHNMLIQAFAVYRAGAYDTEKPSKNITDIGDLDKLMLGLDWADDLLEGSNGILNLENESENYYGHYITPNTLSDNEKIYDLIEKSNDENTVMNFAVKKSSFLINKHEYAIVGKENDKVLVKDPRFTDTTIEIPVFDFIKYDLEIAGKKVKSF